MTRLDAGNALDLIARLRHRRRRLRQFRHALSGLRRLLLRQEAAGHRRGRHLRRLAHHAARARDARRRHAQSDLSLSVSRAAAGRHGAGLRRSRHPRRAARRARLDDGAGSDPRDRRLRRRPGRPAADGRCALDAVRDAELCVGPGQSAQRREADDQGFVGTILRVSGCVSAKRASVHRDRPSIRSRSPVAAITRCARTDLQHRRQHAIRRLVAVHEGLDVDDDLLAHVDAAFERGRAHMRQQHDLAARARA